MIQKEFANNVVKLTKTDPFVIGLAAGGSWISNELDEYSDLDLVLITKEKIAGDKSKMLGYANSFGNLLSAFTGEHVGEPRLLICLYDKPVLHVDIKFLTLPEFAARVENPVILFERDGQLSTLVNVTQATWPGLDYQWIEDRFWTWVHYIAAKIGRGEYFECLDSFAFLRLKVIAPLLQIKNKGLPRGLRKVETQLSGTDLENLKSTVAQYDRASIIHTLENIIRIYRSLQEELFPGEILLRKETEQKSIAYFERIISDTPPST